MSTANGIGFDKLCRVSGLPVPMPEYRFALAIGRQWRFDWAWPDRLVALEVEGGAFAGGRHTRGAGFREDLKKYNTAALHGWVVLRVLPEHLTKPDTFDMLRRAMTIRRKVTPE